LPTISRPRASTSSESTPSSSPSARISKKAVDGLLRNPYASSKQTALDVTVNCPACPTYLTPAAAACNTRCTDQAEVAKHTKYRQIAADVGVHFSVAAFTYYGGWGSEFRNKYVEPYYKSELKAAKANSGDGWDVLNRKGRFVRHVAAVICRENSRMLSSAARMRHAACWEPRRRTWPLFLPWGK
jgi:hypothetical protein